MSLLILPVLLVTVSFLGGNGLLLREDTALRAVPGELRWQKAATNLLQTRRQLVADLNSCVATLELSERKTATIAYDDMAGMQAVEAMRLLGQLRAAEVVSMLVCSLNVRAPVIPGKSATFLSLYPAAEALAAIGIPALDTLLMPDPTRIIEKNNPALEIRLIGAVVQEALGRTVGIAYVEERLERTKDSKMRTRLVKIAWYLRTHTAMQLQTGR